MSSRIPGDFVPLDVNYPRDPAIRRAGEAAELLYVRALAFAKQANTDGIVYDFDLEVVGAGLKNLPKRADALVRERLWVEVEGGWQIRSWCTWNATEQEKAAHREKQRMAAIRTNHRRWHKTEADPDCPLCEAQASEQ